MTLPVRVPDRVALGLMVRVTVTVPLPVVVWDPDADGEGEMEREAQPEAVKEALPVSVRLALGVMVAVEARVGGCVLVAEWLVEGLELVLRVPVTVPVAQGLEAGELLVKALGERVRVTELVTVSLREPEASPEAEGVTEGTLEAVPDKLGLLLCVTEILFVSEGVKEGDMVMDRVGDVEAQKEGV